MKQTYLKGHVQKCPWECLYITIVVSPNPSANPSTSLVMKTPENTEEDPDDPEQADGGDIPMEYSSD